MNPDNSLTTVLERDSPPVQDHAPTRRWTPPDGAAIITILVVLGAVATMLLHRSPRAGLSAFTVEHIKFLSMVDTSRQRWAHRVSLLLLGVLCVLGTAAITHPAAQVRLVADSFRKTREFFEKWSGALFAVVSALVLLLDLQGTTYPSAIRRLRLNLLLLSVCLTVLGLLWVGRHCKTRALVVTIWICVILCGLFLVLPGLARAPLAFEPNLSWAEWHYSAALAQGDRLAAGLRVGAQVNLNYGLIPPLALGVFERAQGFLDFGEHFRLVQICQIAFLAIAVLAYYLWRPGNPFYVLFGILLVGPWAGTSHPAMFYPNQTGWRSLGLAVGAAVLVMCRHRPLSQAALILGASASFLLLYNPETGLCMSFGYGLFLISRLRNLALDQIAGIALHAILGASVVGLAVLIFYRAGLGAWPSLAPSFLFGYIGRFGQGYGGLPLYFDPLALLIFIHSIYVVASSVLKWRVRDLEFDESAKLAIAATIVTWSAYYVNRPQAWNLWTYQFLYLFLVADLFEARLFRRLRRRGIAAAVVDIRVAPLTFVLVPMLLSANYFILVSTVFPNEKPEIIPARISGIFVPQETAGALRAKADFLMSQEANGTLFFTRHSYSLSLLTLRFNPLAVQDAFAETISNADFEGLVREIYRISPRIILFDTPDDGSMVAENKDINSFSALFFDRLKIRLAERYHQESTTSGWQVWKLELPESKFDAQETRRIGTRKSP
jgi:hypothetical protein